jgi:hypothetical protein
MIPIVHLFVHVLVLWYFVRLICSFRFLPTPFDLFNKLLLILVIICNEISDT